MLSKPEDQCKIVDIECRVKNLCSKEGLFFSDSDKYFLKKNKSVTYTTMEHGQRYSASFGAQAIFNECGTFALTCRTGSGASTTVNVTVEKQTTGTKALKKSPGKLVFI